ncbi:ABC transporter ATP-binding protein [Mycoplasma hafezii]|uniref:ABC transporter ATP-binding protein n=1 Tax=Mycoplasma hafezii TaxID=525886 RepID=UPI003CFB18EC
MLQMFRILPAKIKAYFGIGIIFVLINVALTMIIPILISQFIPLLIPDDNAGTGKFAITLFKDLVIYTSDTRSGAIKFLISISIGAILAATISSIISVFIIIWAGENASNFYRNTLFKKYQKLSLKDISKLTTESLITRINDDVAVFWDFLINATTSLIKAPLFIIIGIVFAFSTDVNFAWSIVGIIPILILVFVFIFWKSNPLIKQNRKNLDKITKEAEETIVGARFIRAYNLQEKQKNKFFNINNKWMTVENKTFRIIIIGTPAFFGIINLVIVAIFIMASNLIQNGSATPQLLAKINVFIEYEFILATGIMIFALFIGSFIRAKISAKRITEVLNTKYDNLKVEGGYKITDHLGQTNDISNYSVEFKDLSYKYFSTSKDYAISNINFKIKGGETLGIIGPTGSGKSTIANLLVNNMKYDEGNILINNKEVKEINTKELHSKVGIVYQEPLLYSGTIRSNMMFANDQATDKELERALNTACALDFIKTFDDRLDHTIEQRGKNLSGGQKQRLSIARTLLIDPKVLILDDSTSALDNITTKKLIQNIKHNYDCTTIIISQKINSIKHADNILVMDKGKIIAQGTHDELLQTCEWYKEVNNNQLKQ